MALYTNTAGVPAAIIYTNFERKKQAKSLVINFSCPLFSDLLTAFRSTAPNRLSPDNFSKGIFA
jgi:hypothetical protein